MKAVRILLIAAVSALALQANAQGVSTSTSTAPGAKVTKEIPFVNAEIRKVDAAGGKLTLKHETIPNLDMPAMTMVFAVADRKWLKDLKAGGKVRVKIETVQGLATVTALEAGK